MKTEISEDVRRLLDRQGTSDLAFDAIATSLMGEFAAEAAVVYTLDGGTGMLKLRCHRGIPAENSDKIRFLCMGKGLPGLAASSRAPVQGLLHGESACVEERDILPEGSLFIPMISEERLRGVLGIAKTTHSRYAPDEVAALSGIGRLIASYLK